MNNTPIHAPLYPVDGAYGSSDYESISILISLDMKVLVDLLTGTPFSPVVPYVWLEAMTLRKSEGIASYGGGGVIIPASYKNSIGGYYAFCYVDTDDSLALGREAYGYPKKYARVNYQRTGRAITASFRRETLSLDLSLVVDTTTTSVLPDAPRYPHLLFQVIPTADHKDALFKRVLARDTSRSSQCVTRHGEGAIAVASGVCGNELEWLGRQPEVIGAMHTSGSFKSDTAKVLGIEGVSKEMQDMFLNKSL